MTEAATLEPLTISASAAKRLNAILKGEDGAALRVSVKGGGCSGFSYAFDIETTGRAADDLVVTRDGATVLVDDLMGQSFQVRNPNAVASCGCGVSFSV